ncbi:Vacuolar protein sorting-associated protein 62 [Macleaya cordata]|uniref:Vacuolar protein sorting-associated protein 62 n=1 Tax=Macleaya cordata TaxID=56857 RepID=A0A200QFV4_MACCD|nr:Vacuolar protein sorting-associated protein 62 [Macleaya cordata]
MPCQLRQLSIYPLPYLLGHNQWKHKLGGLEVYQISTFTKVWASLEGGPGNLGATFFEPSSIPNGYYMLGCYSQPNNQPLFGWVLVGKDNGTGTLTMPMDYTLVWSSESSTIKKDGNGYIWLPVAPERYRVVGHVVTNSPAKPALDKILCVRSDLTDSCERTALIWGVGGINVYGLRPTSRGTQALGVSVGTFVAEADGSQSSFSALSCLKNRDSNLSCMPNLNQIQALVQTYSPWIYLHPDEAYLPSSASWFFTNGALLYKQGNESNPLSIDPKGSNLPQGGSDDGTYWLDLPIDKSSKERVKKGDLQSSESYLHVKPMLGATFTDIALWIFYPFNGPARAKVELINIPLGKIGQHVGDWEHLTLRINNFSGKLWSVYFSEHSKGVWVNASELEYFQGGNKVVAYSSLHGHAFYPKPGLVLQGNTSLGIGIRNDTAKSKIMMNTGERYVVVSAEHLGTIIEPPWLNYTRKWGPKLGYNLADELKNIEKLLPGKLKDAFKRVVDGLPKEVLGEEGPTGPKMKNSWSGDEPV